MAGLLVGHIVNRRVGGLEVHGCTQQIHYAVNRRVGGLEVCRMGRTGGLDVNRRVGGLEDYGTWQNPNFSVNRREGGLEDATLPHKKERMVNRRVGGLEASQANQRPGCCVTQAGLPQACTRDWVDRETTAFACQWRQGALRWTRMLCGKNWAKFLTLSTWATLTWVPCQLLACWFTTRKMSISPIN